MVKDLRDTHKQNLKTLSNLMKSIDRLTNQMADLSNKLGTKRCMIGGLQVRFRETGGLKVLSLLG